MKISLRIVVLLFSKFGFCLTSSKMKFTKCCPGEELLWNERKDDLACGEGKDYHCMQTRRERFVEFCSVKSVISLGLCPVTYNGSQIDNHSRCMADRGTCPQRGIKYVSSQLYRYPGCFTSCDHGDKTTVATKAVLFTKLQAPATSDVFYIGTRTTTESTYHNTIKSTLDSRGDELVDNTWLVDTTSDMKSITKYEDVEHVGGSSDTEFMKTMFTYGGIAGLAILFMLFLMVSILLLQRFKGKREISSSSEWKLPLCTVTSSASRGPLPEVPAIIITEETEYDHCTYDDDMVLKKEEFKLGACTSSLVAVYESPTTMTKYESLKNVCEETPMKRNIYDSLDKEEMIPNQNDGMNRYKKCVSI